MSAIIINAYASAFQVVQDRVAELEQRVKELEDENMALHLFDALGVRDDDLDTLDYDEVAPVKEADLEAVLEAMEDTPVCVALTETRTTETPPATETPPTETPPATETPPTETPPATETPPTKKPATKKAATKKPATKKPATKKPKKTPTFEHGFTVGDTFADGAVVITKLTACFVTFDEMSLMGNANKKRVRIQQDYTNNGWYFMAKCGKCSKIPAVPTPTPEHVLLGVPATATHTEIKHALHKMGLIHHPDKGGDAETMRKILEAYKKLKEMTE